jgi:peptidoglycan hydrolase CwlO-like protein
LAWPVPPANRSVRVSQPLVIIAGGLAIWALGLQSDLDDQRDQTSEAQAQAEQAGNEVEALSGQIDEIGQAVTDARRATLAGRR